jgi:hypothetical protein
MRYRRVQTLTADGDVPILSADMHPILGWYARAKLYLLTDDPEMHNAIIATLPRELQGENLAAGQLRVPQVRQVPASGRASRRGCGPAIRRVTGSRSAARTSRASSRHRTASCSSPTTTA